MALRPGTALGLLAGFLLAPLLCFSQSVRPEDLAQGKILITPRDAPDPHFANSVVLLAHYDRSGALGLMLHYKSDLSPAKILPGVSGVEKRTNPVFIGGPVQLPAVFALLRSKISPPESTWVTGNLYLLMQKQAIGQALAERAPADLRLFIGYAGWAPGQLESEVRHHGWYIFDYDEKLVFDDHPETLWDRLIEKTGRSLAILR